MARRRLRLVPEGGVECFEIRIVLYFDPSGDSMVNYSISDPQEEAISPPRHEVLGVMDMAHDMIAADYERGL